MNILNLVVRDRDGREAALQPDDRDRIFHGDSGERGLHGNHRDGFVPGRDKILAVGYEAAPHRVDRRRDPFGRVGDHG